jgi:hypothetical protein
VEKSSVQNGATSVAATKTSWLTVHIQILGEIYVVLAI